MKTLGNYIALEFSITKFLKKDVVIPSNGSGVDITPNGLIFFRPGLIFFSQNLLIFEYFYYNLGNILTKSKELWGEGTFRTLSKLMIGLFVLQFYLI